MDVAHEVKTSHGTVTVQGKDITLYKRLEDWVKDHRDVIATALSLTSVALSSVLVHHVKKKP